MPTASVLESQQSCAAAEPIRDPAGCWRLPERQALSLRSRGRSRLRVEAGGLWVTVTPPGRGAGAGISPGDQFLRPGDALVVEAGARTVLEPWPRGAGGAAFAWDPVAVAEDWQALVAQPWAELAGRTRSALRHAGAAGAAAGRLAAGLWRFAGMRCRGGGGTAAAH